MLSRLSAGCISIITARKKDDVFAALKKNVKITKENIPAATQLFTPDWIVRYMVENSLGRLWLEGHPDVKEQLLPTEEEQSAYAAGNRDPEDTKWHYYLEEAEQEPEVQAQLAEIRKEYATLTPDQLKVIEIILPKWIQEIGKIKKCAFAV